MLTSNMKKPNFCWAWEGDDRAIQKLRFLEMSSLDPPFCNWESAILTVASTSQINFREGRIYVANFVGRALCAYWINLNVKSWSGGVDRKIDRKFQKKTFHIDKVQIWASLASSTPFILLVQNRYQFVPGSIRRGRLSIRDIYPRLHVNSSLRGVVDLFLWSCQRSRWFEISRQSLKSWSAGSGRLDCWRSLPPVRRHFF